MLLVDDAHDGREALAADRAHAKGRRTAGDALRAGDAEARVPALEEHRLARAVPADDAQARALLRVEGGVLLRFAILSAGRQRLIGCCTRDVVGGVVSTSRADRFADF